jgi:hypothetical protein
MKIWSRDWPFRVLLVLGVINFFTCLLTASDLHGDELTSMQVYCAFVTLPLALIAGFVLMWRKGRRSDRKQLAPSTEAMGPYRTLIPHRVVAIEPATSEPIRVGAALVLTRLENAALDKLLEGEHETLSVLRRQLRAVILASRHVEEGQLLVELHIPDGVDTVEGAPDLRIDDVIGNISNRVDKARFTLTVRKGRLDRLEAALPNETWLPNPDHFFFDFAETPGEPAGVHQRWIVKL